MEAYIKNTFNNLICEYKKFAEIYYNIHNNFDLNKKSVRRANNSVNKMIKISKYINSKYPQRINKFADLLNCKEYKINNWVAHHILENMNYTQELENKALEVIIFYSKKESVESLGNRMWLKDWYKKKKSN